MTGTRPVGYLGLMALLLGCTGKPKIEPPVPVDQQHRLAIAERCKDWVGEPRIEQFGDKVFGAFGYDLANVFLIKTDAGNVFIDAGLSPKTSSVIFKELTARAPGKTLALIYTHSHLDHVGGAGAIADGATEIWASTPFQTHFLKQYGVFQPVETIRGRRQYGLDVPPEILPCTSIGAKPDLAAAFDSAARLPTKTFSGEKTLVFGKTKLTLFEAHGETHDELAVWLADDRILFPGDNIYRAFPNLYTIRGTSPRPVDDWIKSLDRMRALEPEVLLPSHTRAIRGKDLVQETLTVYRDGIQWVRDAVVRGANAGLSAATLAETIKLPPELAKHPYLEETYGQVDWSVRAIYSDNLGWFAGEPERLYPMDRNDAAKREVGLLGGADAVMKLANTSLVSGDLRWGIHLLTKVRDSGLATGALHDQLLNLLAHAFGKLALETQNSNGRGYLAESAVELTQRVEPPKLPNPDQELVRSLPLDVFMDRWSSRLKMNDAVGIHESLVMEFPDVQRTYFITLRHGIMEVTEGQPLPGTPAPFATVTVDSMTWKNLALKQENAAAAVASGKIQVQGSWVAFGKFLQRFELQ